MVLGGVFDGRRCGHIGGSFLARAPARFVRVKKSARQLAVPRLVLHTQRQCAHSAILWTMTCRDKRLHINTCRWHASLTDALEGRRADTFSMKFHEQWHLRVYVEQWTCPCMCGPRIGMHIQVGTCRFMCAHARILLPCYSNGTFVCTRVHVIPHVYHCAFDGLPRHHTNRSRRLGVVEFSQHTRGTCW